MKQAVRKNPPVDEQLAHFSRVLTQDLTLHEHELLAAASPGIDKSKFEVYKGVVSSSIPLAVCRQSGVVVARAMSRTAGSSQTVFHCITGVGSTGSQVLPDLVLGEKFPVVADKQAYTAEVVRLPKLAVCTKTGFSDAIVLANVNEAEVASSIKLPAGCSVTPLMVLMPLVLSLILAKPPTVFSYCTTSRRNRARAIPDQLP